VQRYAARLRTVPSCLRLCTVLPWVGSGAHHETITKPRARRPRFGHWGSYGLGMIPSRRKNCGACGSRLEHHTNGRPRLYCGDACRQRAQTARRSKGRRGHRNDWWTPEELRARVLGEHPIGLDAAACADSALVPAWLGPTHPEVGRRDAVALPSWAHLVEAGASCFLNPPYGPPPLIEAFLHTSAATAADGVTVLALIPAATSTHWWDRGVVQHGASVEYLTGRLRFGGPHSDGNPATFASALVTYPGSVS
jgi:hypothetical protein